MRLMTLFVNKTLFYVDLLEFRTTADSHFAKIMR